MRNILLNTPPVQSNHPQTHPYTLKLVFTSWNTVRTIYYCLYILYTKDLFYSNINSSHLHAGGHAYIHITYIQEHSWGDLPFFSCLSGPLCLVRALLCCLFSSFGVTEAPCWSVLPLLSAPAPGLHWPLFNSAKRNCKLTRVFQPVLFHNDRLPPSLTFSLLSLSFSHTHAHPSPPCSQTELFCCSPLFSGSLMCCISSLFLSRSCSGFLGSCL